MLKWSLKENTGPSWPQTETGEPVAPVFLTHVYGSPLDTELTLNLLNAYDIPTIRQYPRNGTVGKIIMGQAQGGIDIYVPETMLEDAQNIMSADIEDDPGED